MNVVCTSYQREHGLKAFFATQVMNREDSAFGGWGFDMLPIGENISPFVPVEP